MIFSNTSLPYERQTTTSYIIQTVSNNSYSLFFFFFLSSRIEPKTYNNSSVFCVVAHASQLNVICMNILHLSVAFAEEPQDGMGMSSSVCGPVIRGAVFIEEN